MTHIAYNAIGGVEQALVSYAEGVYATLTDDEQIRAQHIFIQLVRPGKETEATRRVASRADIGEKNLGTRYELADARLVVTSTAHDEIEKTTQVGTVEVPQDTVEVVHEALIQRWDRLQKWINTAREFRMWQERLRTLMPKQTKIYTKDELLRGSMLTDAVDWLRTPPPQPES